MWKIYSTNCSLHHINVFRQSMGGWTNSLRLSKNSANSPSGGSTPCQGWALVKPSILKQVVQEFGEFMIRGVYALSRVNPSEAFDFETARYGGYIGYVRQQTFFGVTTSLVQSSWNHLGGTAQSRSRARSAAGQGSFQVFNACEYGIL